MYIYTNTNTHLSVVLNWWSLIKEFNPNLFHNTQTDSTKIEILEV